jgi:hypothetical protein
MRQQQAIVAASGPRTPINDPTSKRIGVPRNGGDSGIFTAAGRLRPLSSFDRKGADAGLNQNCSSAQCGRSSPFRPRTTAPCAVPTGGGPQPLWTIPHQNTRRRRPTAAFLAGDVTPLAGLALSPHGRSPPAVGRADNSTGPASRVAGSDLCIRSQEALLWPSRCRDQARGDLSGAYHTRQVWAPRKRTTGVAFPLAVAAGQMD